MQTILMYRIYREAKGLYLNILYKYRKSETFMMPNKTFVDHLFGILQNYFYVDD